MSRLSSGDLKEEQNSSLPLDSACRWPLWIHRVTCCFDTSQSRTVTTGRVPSCTFGGKARPNGNLYPVARHGSPR
jgi:hypothetical protein